VSDELDILRASLLSGVLHELHITRASQWTDADQHPITRAEWESFAEAHLKLSHQGAASWKSVELNEDGSVGSMDTGSTPIYRFMCKDGAIVRLSWRDDHVKAWGELLGREAALATLAVQFRARLLGDDEEEYLPDGSRADWDEFRKPITPLDGAVALYPIPPRRAGPAVDDRASWRARELPGAAGTRTTRPSRGFIGEDQKQTLAARQRVRGRSPLTLRSTMDVSRNLSRAQEGPAGFIECSGAARPPELGNVEG
jgi:hypothetical protein